MIIGIVGKAGSGKDSVADHLVANHNFVKASFAKPIKEVLHRLFAMSWEQLNEQDLKEVVDVRYGFSPRWLMQQFGTDFCRKLYPNIWVDLLIREYERDVESARSVVGTAGADGEPRTWDMISPRWVISDTRFINEAKAIEETGGHVWRVVCPDNPKQMASNIKGKVGSTLHPSEVEQEKIVAHQTLTARFGDLGQSYAAADTLMKELL